jgi:hypothetical protein
MEAVKQHGRALQCASVVLQGDRKVVMAAVKQEGRALGYKAPQQDEESAKNYKPKKTQKD